MHTARVIEKWFQDEEVCVIEWPATSPDLNIIENLLDILVRNVYENQGQFNGVQDIVGVIKKRSRIS